MYFRSAGGARDGIYVAHLKTKEIAFVAATGDVMRPALSPDGRRIAYAKQVEGRWGIYIYDLSTGIESRVIGA